MAELEIGEHCSFPNCNQLDFLPFNCEDCCQVFCKDHRSKSLHQCIQDVQDTGGVSSEPPTSTFSSYPCELTECKDKVPTQVICEHCRKNFCLRHRHQQDHSCAMLIEKPEPMQKTAELVKKITDSIKSKPPKPKKQLSSKAQKTAAKVALIKMKMHAVGDASIPQTERLYFQVYLPIEHRCKEKSKAMYFSKEWSVGRLVDKIATMASLRNENNLADSKKLRLFHPVVGSTFPMDAKLTKLLHEDEPLFNGGDVIIEYVDNDETQLDDLDLYKV
ncbi:AN1-type zinc finger protein 1-like [Antedon mediterranea]|uniref:AN1-type zinc finger protein 1-like n=1 Tax=Antedon mediterranea TaxID=105859 RepID=UPI003AF7BA2D